MAGIKEAIEKIDVDSAILCPKRGAFVFDVRCITWESESTAFLCPVCLLEFVWENKFYPIG